MLLNHVFPRFNNMKFAYFHPRQPLYYLKQQVSQLIKAQKNFDMVVIDHSLEPFYNPAQHPQEETWQTKVRDITARLVDSLNIPVIIFHSNPQVNTGINRYLPTYYFLVKEHPGNFDFCVNRADQQKKHLVSWLNNGLRGHRCHLLTQFWDKPYRNTDKFLFSFYTNQTFDPNSHSTWTHSPEQLSNLNLSWIEKCCDPQLSASIRNKMSQIWDQLPVTIDDQFTDVVHYDLDWFDYIQDASTSSAFVDSVANIVSETSIFTHQFLTEKTFKPLACGMPIFMQQMPGTVKFLEDAGFDMYSDILDNSYDTVLGYEERMDLLVNAVDKFISQPPAISNTRIRDNVYNYFSDSVANKFLQPLIDSVEEVYYDK